MTEVPISSIFFRYSSKVDQSSSRPASKNSGLLRLNSSLRSSFRGAAPEPQLGKTRAVTPCLMKLSAWGFTMMLVSEWLCMSTKPGLTVKPSASMIRSASAPLRGPTPAILPSLIATLALNQGFPAPVSTLPFLIRISYNLNQQSQVDITII